MPHDPFASTSLNTAGIGLIERGVESVGCFFYVFGVYYTVLNGGVRKGLWGNTYCKPRDK